MMVKFNYLKNNMNKKEGLSLKKNPTLQQWHLQYRAILNCAQNRIASFMLKFDLFARSIIASKL